MLGVFPERDQELGGLHQIFLIEFAFRQEKMQNLIKSFSCAIRKKRIAQTTNYFYPKLAQSQLILEAGAAIVIRVMRQLSLLQERLLQHNESRKARKSASCADHNGADDEDDDAAADG
uniref:HDC11502 n=1 Tax=Drosophila melanogaster TaxID=7227 RepID=Q6IKT7_DROME|nr:TPA_inf: HDC11502 [Drosophila melanogaster]